MSDHGSSVRRADGRAADSLRPVRIEVGTMKFAEGSALIEVGDTKVLVSASVESRVPPFLADSGRGWVTAEYAMLPRATSTRSTREVTRGRPSGRSAEIQRLIGRSLRSVIDLRALPEISLVMDCDVLQADGGTRTAAITGAYVAAVEALARLFLTGDMKTWPFREQLAAISVGIVGGAALLDLDAAEDQEAEVDLNVVATSGGNLVEVQGTGEKRSFSPEELEVLLGLAAKGIENLLQQQNGALDSILTEVEAARSRGDRRPAAPKDERELWGKPE